MSKKVKPPKKKKSSFEKEQIFIKVGTNLLLVIVIALSIFIAFKNTFGNLDTDQSPPTTATLELISKSVNTGSLITRPLNDLNKPTLISKIKSSNWDLLSNDEFDYDKYNAEQITAEQSLSLTDEELGLVYSYLFVNNTDKYDVILYELTITSENNISTIKTVASIDFYRLFTSKLGNQDSSSSLPKRIYVTNTVTVSNGAYSYEQALFNNLTKEQSLEVKNLIKTVNNSNLDSYIPSLIISFIEQLSNKTATIISYSNNQISFTK